MVQLVDYGALTFYYHFEFTDYFVFVVHFLLIEIFTHSGTLVVHIDKFILFVFYVMQAIFERFYLLQQTLDG